MRRRLVVTAAAACISACSLFTSLGDFSNGDTTTPPSTVDASTNGGDSAAVGITNEAGVDAGDDTGPSDAGSWCAAQGKHTLCEDFSGPLSSDWTLLPGPGELRLDPGSSTSGPQSLLLVLPPAVEGGPRLTRDLAVTSLARITCEVGFRRDVIDNSSQVVVLVYNLLTGSGGTFAEIKNNPTSGKVFVDSDLVDGGTATTFPDTPSISKGVGVWNRVRWDLSLKDQTTTVTVDGEEIFTGPIPVTDGTAVKTARISLLLFGPVQGSWSVRFDDLVCDVTPW